MGMKDLIKSTIDSWVDACKGTTNHLNSGSIAKVEAAVAKIPENMPASDKIKANAAYGAGLVGAAAALGISMGEVADPNKISASKLPGICKTANGLLETSAAKYIK